MYMYIKSMVTKYKVQSTEVQYVLKVHINTAYWYSAKYNRNPNRRQPASATSRSLNFLMDENYFSSVLVLRSRTLFLYRVCISTYLYSVLGNHDMLQWDMVPEKRGMVFLPYRSTAL